MSRFVAGLALLLGAAQTPAQTPCALQLRARAVESHTDQPLYPAVLYVDELRQSFEADTEGYFHLPPLCAGTYVLHALADGHGPVVDTIALVANRELHLHLPHDEHTLREVVATETRTQTLVQDRQTINRATLAANSGKNLADLLQQVAGVTTFSNGATIAKPVIHGLSGNRILILNNGVRQEDQQWGGEHAPTIDPFLASSVTVLKGAAGVRYGTDALGGVILVEPAPLRAQPGWSGAVDAAAFSNNRMGVLSAQAERRFDKAPAWAFRVQGTLKRGGNYQLPSGAWAANTGVREANFSGALGYRGVHRGAELFYSRFNTDLGLYRGSHTGNAADLQNAIQSPEPLVPADFTYDLERPRQHVEHQLARLRAYADTRTGLWSVVAAYQHNYRQEYDVQRTETPTAQLNLTLQTATVNMNLDHKPLGPLTGQVGVDGLWQRNRFADGDRLFIPFYDVLAGGAYAIERYRHHDWMLEAGLRYDHRFYHMLTNQGSGQTVVPYDFNFNSLSGTVAAQRTLRSGWTAGLTAARAWRAPQAAELFASGYHQGAARVELGNQNLKPEASYSLTASSDWTRGPLAVHLSLYRQWVRDFIYLEPGADLLTIRGYFKTFRYRQTDATLTGADLSADWAITPHLTAGAKASLLRARDVAADDWLILMPSDRLSGNLRYTHDWGRLKDAFVGADLRHVARQTRVPGNFDALDAPRPPADYTLLGFSTGATIRVKGQPVQLSLSVENALNVRYREYLDAFRYFIDRPGRDVVLRMHLPFNRDSKTSQTNNPSQP